MSEPVYVGMPPTDRTFQVEPWGEIRCGGDCRAYERTVPFQNAGGQVLYLQRAARDSYLAAERKIGRAITVTGSLRTCEKQAELYAGDSNRFAHPDVTGHTRGLCIDVSTALSGLTQVRVRRALKARGWHQSRPDDEPWHFSLGISV